MQYACTDDVPYLYYTFLLVVKMCLIHTGHPPRTAHSIYIYKGTLFLEIHVLESLKFKSFFGENMDKAVVLIDLTLHPPEAAAVCSTFLLRTLENFPILFLGCKIGSYSSRFFEGYWRFFIVTG